MKSIARIVICCFVFAVSIVQTKAQQGNYHFEAGINAGTLIYQGDLVESYLGSFKGAKPMLQLWVSKPFSPYFSWRANITKGNISADESQFANPAWKQVRNFAFSSSVAEFSGMVQYNVYGDNGGDTYHLFTPYVMAGAGISFLNIKRDWSRLNTAAVDPKSSTIIGLGIDTLHSLPKVLPVIPVGLGVRWAVARNININAEATSRLSFSDYIDGFSYSANPKAKDGYYSLSLGVSFVLGGDGVRCPRIRR